MNLRLQDPHVDFLQLRDYQLRDEGSIFPEAHFPVYHLTQASGMGGEMHRGVQDLIFSRAEEETTAIYITKQMSSTISLVH